MIHKILILLVSVFILAGGILIISSLDEKSIFYNEKIASKLLAANSIQKAKSNNLCSGLNYADCLVLNGYGRQTRTCINSKWSDWSECNIDGCDVGYSIESNLCVVTECSSDIDCDDNILSTYDYCIGSTKKCAHSQKECISESKKIICENNCGIEFDNCGRQVDCDLINSYCDDDSNNNDNNNCDSEPLSVTCNGLLCSDIVRNDCGDTVSCSRASTCSECIQNSDCEDYNALTSNICTGTPKKCIFDTDVPINNSINNTTNLSNNLNNTNNITNTTNNTNTSINITENNTSSQYYFNKDFTNATFSGSSTNKYFENWGLYESTNYFAGRVYVWEYNPPYTNTFFDDSFDNNRRSLYMRVNDDDPNRTGTTRTQVSMHFKNNTNLSIYRTSHRMYLSPDLVYLKNINGSISSNGNWMDIFETWLAFNPDWDGDTAGSARISLYINKNKSIGSSLFWQLNCEYMQPQEVKFDNIWDIQNNTIVPVPIGEWFTLDFTVIDGIDSNGRVIVSITPDGGQTTTLFDVRNTTVYVRDGIYYPELYRDSWQPLKFYFGDATLDYLRNNNKIAYVYYNDFKWYKNAPQ